MSIINPKKIYNLANFLKWEEKNSLPCLIARPIVVKIITKLVTGENDSLLDIGCGTGRWTKLFAKRLKKVIGIDIVKAMIEICRERNATQNITYKQADMFKLKQLFQKSEFNIVTVLMVLQYAKNKKELLNLCRDINFLLKPDGILFS